MSRSPTPRQLERALDELNAGRPQCPVGLHTLIVPRKNSQNIAPEAQPMVYLKCGHVQVRTSISQRSNIKEVVKTGAGENNVHFRHLLGILKLAWYPKSRSVGTIWFLGTTLASVYLVDVKNAHYFHRHPFRPLL